MTHNLDDAAMAIDNCQVKKIALGDLGARTDRLPYHHTAETVRWQL